MSRFIEDTEARNMNLFTTLVNHSINLKKSFPLKKDIKTVSEWNRGTKTNSEVFWTADKVERNFAGETLVLWDNLQTVKVVY